MALGTQAQTELSLYNMRSIPQVSRANPAIMPFSRVNFSLPGTNFMAKANSNRFAISEFTNLDPFAEDGEWQQAAIQTFENVNNQLEATDNIFAAETEIDLLSFGFKTGWNYFYFHSTEKISLDFRYPQNLFDIIDPTVDLHGQTITLEGMDLTLMHYREYGLTYARKIIPSLTVGATVKYLYGMDAVRGDDLTAVFSSDITQPTLDFTGSGHIYTSLGAQRAIREQLTSSGVDTSSLQNYLYGYNNHGFGLDLGVNLLLLDRIRLSASVLDIGGINWRENLQSYTEDNFQYSVNYFQEYDTSSLGALIPVGVPLEDFEPLDMFFGVADSIVEEIKNDIKSERFRTTIPTKLNFSVSVALNDRIDVGLLSHSIFNRGSFRQSAMLSSNIRVGNALSLLVSYSAAGGSFTDLGAGLSLNLGALQFYVLTDNALSFLELGKNVHARFGLNFTFNNDFED